MDFLTAFSTGVTAFTATNLDDIVLLMLFFSQASAGLRQRDIVFGQYLGFALLVIASLPGFFGSLILPHAWVGLLGIIPIILGLSHLFEPSDPNEPDESAISLQPSPSVWTHFLSPQTCGVAALTIANGSDNIGIYVPLFANCTWQTLGLILVIFFGLVSVWCYAAYQFTRLPAIAKTLMQYGDQLLPYGLIGLGIMILWESQTLADRGLIVIASMICLGYLLSLNRTLSQMVRSPKTEGTECS